VAFQPAPNCAKVEIRYINAGQQIENVMHFQLGSATYDAAALEELATNVLAVVTSDWMPLVSDEVTLAEVKATDIENEGGISFTAFPASTTIGGKTGNALPNETSFAVRMKAATGGRNGSGRVFWPALTVGQCDTANTLSATSMDDIIDAVQALIDALAVLGHIAVILSRYFNNAQRAEAIPFAIASVNAFDRVLDSQRRRKPGNGS